MKNTIEKILLEFDPEERNLLPALRSVSAAFDYISEEQAKKIAHYFSLPLSQIFETGSFYSEIKFEKSPGVLLEVCSSPNCVVNSSLDLIREIENYFKIKLDARNGSDVCLRTMSCLGLCAKGPILRINGEIFTEMNNAKLHEILEKLV